MSEKSPAKRWSPEDKQRGLIALLTCGTAAAASKLTNIPPATLSHWRDHSETELYAQLYREHGDQINTRIAAQIDGQITQLGEIQQELIDRLKGKSHDLQTRDVPAALKNVGDARSKSIADRRLVMGEATEIVAVGDARDLLADVRKLVEPYTVVDSTAEDA